MSIWWIRSVKLGGQGAGNAEGTETEDLNKGLKRLVTEAQTL